MIEQKIEILLFDLGNVLIEIDFNRVFCHWQRISSLSLAEIQARYTHDEPYQRHERGEISATEYFEYLRVHLCMQNNLSHIAEGWNSIFVGEISETLDLVEKASEQFPCYVFSNTNVIHHKIWSTRFPRVAKLFEYCFVSSDMGLRKPDRHAFEYVANTLGVSPATILFFDDLYENIEGAKVAGMQTVHVRSSADVRDALYRLGYQP